MCVYLCYVHREETSSKRDLFFFYPEDVRLKGRMKIRIKVSPDPTCDLCTLCTLLCDLVTNIKEKCYHFVYLLSSRLNLKIYFCGLTSRVKEFAQGETDRVKSKSKMTMVKMLL